MSEYWLFYINRFVRCCDDVYLEQLMEVHTRQLPLYHVTNGLHQIILVFGGCDVEY